MTFSVSLEKEALIFSAAHFITFADCEGNTICESLHGHNYRVAAEIDGRLDGHGLVIDFIWLRDTLKAITGQLDHRVLLPDRHPDIQVTTESSEIVAKFGDRRWVFPQQDVRRLPLDNTTAERLAEYIGRQLLGALESRGPAEANAVERIAVAVDENEGQWGRWQTRL